MSAVDTNWRTLSMTLYRDDGFIYPTEIKYYYIPSEPGRISGPPEECEPPIPEEIEFLSIDVWDGWTWQPIVEESLSEKERDQIVREIHNDLKLEEEASMVYEEE